MFNYNFVYSMTLATSTYNTKTTVIVNSMQVSLLQQYPSYSSVHINVVHRLILRVRKTLGQFSKVKDNQSVYFLHKVLTLYMH